MPETKRPIDETYEDVEKLIYWHAHRFIQGHGGEFEELVSIANQVFMDSYEQFDISKGVDFSTYLGINIVRRFQDNYWYEKKREMPSLDWQNEFESEGGTFKKFASDVEDYRCTTKFSFEDFTEEMSEDAKTVIRLAIDTPAELAEVAFGKGGDPRNWRSTIRDFLCSMGWSYERVSRTFEEVRGSLNVA